MLIPGVHNTTIVRGSSWAYNVQWFTTEDETPVNLTGWTGVLRIKSSKNDDDALATLTTQNGKLTLDANGNISARLTKAEVDQLPLGFGMWYEIELNSSTESVQLLTGSIGVEP